MENPKPERIPLAARLFIAAIGLAGLTGMAITFRGWIPEPEPRFVVYLVLAIAFFWNESQVSGIGRRFLGAPRFHHARADRAASCRRHCFWRLPAQPHKPVGTRGGGSNWYASFFNTTCIALAVLAAAWVYRQPWFHGVPEGELLQLMLGGRGLFRREQRSPGNRDRAHRRAKHPNGDPAVYAIGRSVITWSGFRWRRLYITANERLGWAFSLALLPPLYLIYRSVRLYFGKMEQEKAHAENMASLHLRTIEALATAIEAKDECTGDHLRRVQVYSLELAKHLGLSSDEVHALQAASILHDIGKLAVPDYIISKPGKLTPDEFDKMKVHTVVGAEILEQVAFPYPVAPIVRSHHEKWDGSGYPDGLKAEDIPIGARILSAVDCLDALASDRQYRRALPLDEAMDYVAGLSGTQLRSAGGGYPARPTTASSSAWPKARRCAITG